MIAAPTFLQISFLTHWPFETPSSPHHHSVSLATDIRMFHRNYKDPEGGANIGMIVCQCLNALSSLIWPTYGPHAAQIHTSDGEFTLLSDSSQPLFSMYSEMAEEEDNRMATLWQKDADGIRVFVSPFIPIHLRTSTKPIYRLDYSLLLLRHFSQCRSKISNPGPKISPSSTSGRFISFSLTLI